MKKITAVFLLIALLLSLAGCGAAKSEETSAPAAESTDPAAQTDQRTEKTAKKDSSGSVLGSKKKDSYAKAAETMQSGDYETAYAMFIQLGKYKDGAELANECYYLQAASLYNKGDYEGARAYYDALGSYKDSVSRSGDCVDKLTAKALCGQWLSSEIDMSERYETIMRNALDEELMGCIVINGMTLLMQLTFSDNGSFTMTLDDAALSAAMDGLISDVRESVLKYSEDVYNSLAQEYNLTLDELLSTLEVKSIEELFYTYLGMTLDEFIAQYVTEEDLKDAMQDITVSGTYEVSGGRVILRESTGEYDAVYDSGSMSITVHCSALDRELVFTKVR